MSDTPAPLSADSLRETLEKALIDCYEQGLEHGHAAEAGVLPTQEHRELIILNAENEILVALQAERQKIADSLPEKKTLKTDIDDSGWEAEGQKFCVECGQYEFEGVLDCRCVGFNEAIEAVRAVLIPPTGDLGDSKNLRGGEDE